MLLEGQAATGSALENNLKSLSSFVAFGHDSKNLNPLSFDNVSKVLRRAQGVTHPRFGFKGAYELSKSKTDSVSE
jgi:hypothetical protein